MTHHVRVAEIERTTPYQGLKNWSMTHPLPVLAHSPDTFWPVLNKAQDSFGHQRIEQGDHQYIVPLFSTINDPFKTNFCCLPFYSIGVKILFADSVDDIKRNQKIETVMFWQLT